MSVSERAKDTEIDAPRFVDRATAKKFLPVSDATLWRLRRAGFIKCSRAGGRVLFDLKSIERYIENNIEK